MRNILLLAICLFGSAQAVKIEGAIAKEPLMEYSKRWTCVNDRCVRANQTATDQLSWDVCKLTCNHQTLWPLPTGKIEISDVLFPINPNSVSIQGKAVSNEQLGPELADLLRNVKKIFQDRLQAMVQKTSSDETKTLSVLMKLKDGKKYSFTQDTDESYKLTIPKTVDGRLDIIIEADNFFGARHGLETLSQLIVFDSVTQNLVIPSSVEIVDAPKYKYRGVLLDTSRNFVSQKTIKMTLDAMSINKLNSFHWHITDSQSFPFYSKTFPLLAKYGAYSDDKVYTPEDIKSIIEYARVRGIRVIPEFDAPAHVGEGWQWVGDNATVCFRAEPWTSYCVEPPCGQLNPTSEKVYTILKGIYSDMMELFESDVFHMGGDEVNINCYNTSAAVVDNMPALGFDRTEEGFLKLWNYFQTKAYGILESIKKPTKAILWTSGLTGKNIDAYLDNKKYIIQIWTKKDDKVISNLIDKNYEIIFSNYDALYFDCGFGAWVGTGNNWCSPYIPWQTVYDNDPQNILTGLGFNFDEKKHLVLGSEATLWTEQADDASVGNRLWPRAAAMAETLWGYQGNWKKAVDRIMYQRDRLMKLGLYPDTLRPQWCLENDGSCYI